MKKERGDKMEWTNILKRSKAHTSRKIRRGRNIHQRFDRPKGGVPMVGAMDDPKLEARKDRPMPDMEAELADATREDLIEMLTEKVKDMPREDIMNLLFRTQGKLGVKITEE